MKIIYHYILNDLRFIFFLVLLMGAMAFQSCKNEMEYTGDFNDRIFQTCELNIIDSVRHSGLDRFLWEKSAYIPSLSRKGNQILIELKPNICTAKLKSPGLNEIYSGSIKSPILFPKSSSQIIPANIISEINGLTKFENHNVSIGPYEINVWGWYSMRGQFSISLELLHTNSTYNLNELFSDKLLQIQESNPSMEENGFYESLQNPSLWIKILGNRDAAFDNRLSSVLSRLLMISIPHLTSFSSVFNLGTPFFLLNQNMGIIEQKRYFKEDEYLNLRKESAESPRYGASGGGSFFTIFDPWTYFIDITGPDSFTIFPNPVAQINDKGTYLQDVGGHWGSVIQHIYNPFNPMDFLWEEFYSCGPNKDKYEIPIKVLNLSIEKFAFICMDSDLNKNLTLKWVNAVLSNQEFLSEYLKAIDSSDIEVSEKEYIVDVLFNIKDYITSDITLQLGLVAKIRT